MPIRAVLFDKDGTFVDFMATWGPAIAQTMRTLSGGNNAALVRLAEVNRYDLATGRLSPESPFIAEASVDFARRWADALGVPMTPAFHRSMDALLDAGALANVAPLAEPDMVFAALKTLSCRVGVVTNDTEAGARAQCDKLGLLPHLDAIIGYDSGFGRKPDAGPVLAALEQLGVQPEQAMLVGDSRHDLAAARAAGTLAVAVLSGFADADALIPHADHVLDDIRGLPDLVRRLAIQPAR